MNLSYFKTKTFPSNRLEQVRDIFLFSCYTGYAYAEVLVLTPEHIGVGLDGEKCVFMTRGKTDGRSNAMLLPIALELTEKYRNHPECVRSGRLFPVTSNQKYNDYLKEIAAICGKKRRLHFILQDILLLPRLPLLMIYRLNRSALCLDIRVSELHRFMQKLSKKSQQ